MATAGDGGANTAYAYERSGGAGGKLRKRPFRRTTQITPYDRPPTTLHNSSNTSGNSDGSWLSKLVLDPASKLLSTSAHYFFRKRLPPLSSSIPPPEATQEQSNGLQVEVPVKHDGEVSAVVEDGNHTNSSNDIGISKLEQMLRQTTFTRSEVDRLSELLRSRIFDLPVVDSDRSEANLSEQVSELGKQQGVANGLAKENKTISEGFNGIISTTVVSSRVLEEDVAPPVELAKAYMGRPSKVSPSVLRFRSQVLREDVDMINNIQFTPRSATRSLTPKISTGLSFTSPRSRGRSAIYSMARMPCSKIHPVTTQQDAGFTNDISGGSQWLSSSNHAWEHGGKFVSKQVRRSSVIDDEIGSLRRVRQKTNILSQGNPLSICRVEVGFNSQHRFLSSTKKPIIITEPVNKVSKIVGENEGRNVPSTNYPSVPFKSSEMATKILQYLEKLTPKEKSSESKLLSARDKLPLKLMPETLCVSTLKSVEEMDSPKLFQNSEDSHMLKGVQNALSPDICDSISEKGGKVEENGIRKFSVSPNMSIPVKNGDTTISAKDVISCSRTVDAVTKDLVAQPVQKKWAFQISAPEVHVHSLELNGDIHSNGPASSPAAELKEKPEASVVEKEVVSKEATKVVKTKSKTHGDPVLNKIADFEPFDGSVVGVKNNGFTTSTSIFNASSQQTVLSQLTPENSRSAEAKEANSLLFSFSSKVGDKIPQNAYSSRSHINEPSGPKYNATLNLSPENSNSFATVQLKVPEPEKVENKNADKSWGTIGTLKDPLVSGSTSAASSTFSFDGLAKNSNSLGSRASSPIAVTVPASINTMNKIFGSGSHVASSTSSSLNVASTTSMSSSSISTVAPSFTTSPISKFGSSMSSSSLSVAPTTLTTEPLEIISKSEKEGTIDNLSRSVFGSTSFRTTTRGSIFGLSSSGTSSTINSQFQGSLFSTGNGLVSTQLSPYGSGATAVSQSMPIQFGSSAIFGTPAMTSSSNSLFASSTPAKLFGSSSSFGLNSSAYSSETEYASSSSSAMPSMFNFDTSSSSFSSGANSVSSSAVTTHSIFGVSSSTSSSAPNFINSNTAAAANAFVSSFVSASVSGSSTANPSTVATPSVFTFGGSSLASSSGTNSISSACGATSSLFSSHWQPNLIGSTFSSISPTVFSFGASSSSSAATSSPPIFGASTGSFLSSTSASTRSLASQSQPIFGNSTSVFAAPSGNGDQINMEDSMTEDTVHATTAVPVFGQPPSQTDFTFGSTAPLSATPFQFVGQQNQTAPQNFSAFQASTNLEFNGGNFSLGSGGGDKSNRKFVKVSRNRNRRK